MTTEAPPRLTDKALAALRDVVDHGTDRDRERARLMLLDAGLLADPMLEARERIRAGGPMLLGEELMPETMTGARSPLHDELNAFHLREASSPPGQREAVAAPRGHGKTTAGVEVAAVYHAAYCTRRFQVIVSDTDDQATQRIAAIKAHVESNEELGAMFPKLRPAFGYGEVGTWRERDLVFACGCRISARGAGASMRGMKHRERRPDLLYLDDLEDETSVATAYQLAKRLKWLQRVALGLAGPKAGMSVLWVGTILSRTALLNLATGAALDEGQQRPKWAGAWLARIFRAEVDGSPRIPTTATVEDPDTGATFDVTYDVGEPMWSELTRVDLARIRGELGDESYAAEYQADPVPEGESGLIARPIPVEWLNPQAAPRDRIVRMPDGRGVPVSSMTVAAALDPQFANAGESNDPDLACVAVVGQLGAETFLLDAWIGRDRQGQAGILVARALAWGAYAAGVEKVAAQVLVADQAAQLARVPVVPMTPTEGKTARALGLSVRSTQGRVFALVAEGQVGELPEYLVRFPFGRYDDPVDAVVMALELATSAAPAASTMGTPILGGTRPH